MRPEHLSLLRDPSAPAVHPDGTWAVLAISRPDLEEDAYPSRLWRLDLDDGSLRPLTHGFRDTQPVMSPDGKHVAFIRAEQGDKPQVALLPTGGGEARLLTDHPVGVAGPVRFSPDSRRIVYTARVPEQGRYGTAKDVGADAEPPRHITRFTYRLDGIGFYADRPQHVFVIDVPEPDDEPGTPVARADDGAAGEESGTGLDADRPARAREDGAREDGARQEGARQEGARQDLAVAPVQLTRGQCDHRNPVWTHDGAHVLIVRAVVDELRTELIRVSSRGCGTDVEARSEVGAGAGADVGSGAGSAANSEAGSGTGSEAGAGADSNRGSGAGSAANGDAESDVGAGGPAGDDDVEVLQGPEHGVAEVRMGSGGRLWLLASDLGPDGMDFIGKTPALYSADLSDAGLSDLRRHTDPRTGSLAAGVFEVDGDDVLLTRLNRGSTELVRYTGGDLQPAFAGQVSVTGAAAMPGGGGVVLTAGTTDSAGEVFVLDEHAEEQVRRLTDLAATLRAQAPVATPAELQVDGADGYPVHGWVTMPEGEGPHPVLLLIHGGPHSQYESAFFDEVQVYTRAGYAVVFCNPRGSSGYGQDHGRAIIEGFGDRDAADVLAFLDGALAAHPQLDGRRMGVLGGSYGGYMTAWLTTRTDRFTAAIVERGFLDPVSFEGSSDIGWFFGLRYLGEDPQQVAAQSPMAHIDKVSTPTLVIHSEQDWRCPVEQGQRWFVGLKRRGVEAELLLFPGEGHELSRSGRPKHRLARFEHILTWWGTHLPVG